MSIITWPRAASDWWADHRWLEIRFLIAGEIRHETQNRRGDKKPDFEIERCLLDSDRLPCLERC